MARTTPPLSGASCALATKTWPRISSVPQAVRATRVQASVVIGESRRRFMEAPSVLFVAPSYWSGAAPEKEDSRERRARHCHPLDGPDAIVAAPKPNDVVVSDRPTDAARTRTESHQRGRLLVRRTASRGWSDAEPANALRKRDDPKVDRPGRSLPPLG